MSRRARKTRRQKTPSAERPPRRWVWAVAAGGLLVLLVTVWASRGTRRGTAAEEVGVRREPGLDVLLITVDTLRADALGSYGKAGAETLWLDRLAAGGVRFDNAHAHNVLTLPSHVNILSGLYPQEHGIRDNSGFRVPRGLVTLASVLRAQGYRTGAFVSAFPLDSRFGLDEGFDVYEDSFADTTDRTAFLEQERRGTETVALARSWLAAAGGRPSFCWVHLGSRRPAGGRRSAGSTSTSRIFPMRRRRPSRSVSATIPTRARWRRPTPPSGLSSSRSSPWATPGRRWW